MPARCSGAKSELPRLHAFHKTVSTPLSFRRGGRTSPTLFTHSVELIVHQFVNDCQSGSSSPTPAASGGPTCLKRMHNGLYRRERTDAGADGRFRGVPTKRIWPTARCLILRQLNRLARLRNPA